MASNLKIVTVWIRADRRKCFRNKGIWRYAWWFTLDWHEMRISHTIAKRAESDPFLEVIYNKPEDSVIITQSKTKESNTKWAVKNPTLMSVLGERGESPESVREDDRDERSPGNVEALLKQIAKKEKAELARSLSEESVSEEVVSLEELLNEDTQENQDDTPEAKPKTKK